MNIKYLKYFLSASILLTSLYGVNAQIKLHTFIDIGENNASDRIFIKNVYRSSYGFHKFSFEAGMQFDLISNNPNAITGLDFICSREFKIKYFPFDVIGSFMLNRFSDLLHETNWGIRMETRKFEHFLFVLGTNFKSYTLNSAARIEYNINKSNITQSENFGMTYVITAFLKPNNNDWNVGLSCTNIDYYIMNQPTNPVFNLQMNYTIKSNLILYVHSWYKQAGIFNISANYFGYFFRGGIVWKI